jgi:hypothetical protein
MSELYPMNVLCPHCGTKHFDIPVSTSAKDRGQCRSCHKTIPLQDGPISEQVAVMRKSIENGPIPATDDNPRAARLHKAGGVAVFSAEWCDTDLMVTVHPRRDGAAGYVWIIHKSNLPDDVVSTRIAGGETRCADAGYAIRRAVSLLLSLVSPKRASEQEKDNA